MKVTEDGIIVTSAQFLSEICVPIKAIDGWVERLSKKFGSLALDNPAVDRVRSYLLTRKGREEVRALLRENVPLHGHSSTSRGVAVCTEQLAFGDYFRSFTWLVTSAKPAEHFCRGSSDLRLWDELTKQQNGQKPDAAAGGVAGSQSVTGSTAAMEEDAGLGLLDLGGEDGANGDSDEFELHAQKQFDAVYLHADVDDACLQV